MAKITLAPLRAIDTLRKSMAPSQFATGVPWYVDDFFSAYRRDWR